MAEVIEAAFRMITPVGGSNGDADGARGKVDHIFESFGMSHKDALSEEEFRLCAKNNFEVMHALSQYSGLV
jgi:hypothetical protein